MVGTTRAVFLSYRREETRHIAGRLADRLTDLLGSAQVFMDVDTVEPGVDFAAAIARDVASCDVLIALIGPTWSTMVDRRGRRKLNDPDDFVVLEIRAALEHEIHVIPVLVDGAVMPDRSELPKGLKDLTRRNAIRLEHETFRANVVLLLDTLNRILTSKHEAFESPFSGRDGEFRLGPLHTPFHILEGDGEIDIREDMVRVIVDHVDVELPEELSEWRAEIHAEQEKNKKMGARYLWNGLNYAVSDLIISRHGIDETPEVSVRFKYSDYYTFLATQQLDRKFRDGTTPRSRYIEPNDVWNVPDFMRCSFGLNMAVVTSDGQLVVSLRSGIVASAPGTWNSSANEAVSRSLDSQGRNEPNLFDVARRGIREELAVYENEYTLQLLAFCVDTRRSMWGALFLAKIKASTLTSSALFDRISRGVPDRWEHERFDFVEFKPHSVLRYLLREDKLSDWASGAPSLFYLSLVREYGRIAVERAAAEVLRE